MSDRLYALFLSARTSALDYRVVYPWRLLCGSTLPRAVLQVGFFALLGEYVGGAEGRDFVFVGAATQIVVLATTVRAPDVLVDERVFGTLHRLRLGIVPLPALLAARWWIYIVEGVLSSIASIVGVGLLLLEPSLVLTMLLAMPIVALVAVTTSWLGLTVAALSMTRRGADLLATNLVSYATLILCGVVAPLDALGPLGSRFVQLLPLTNGLLAIRAIVDGRAWAGHVAMELVVGASWFVVAMTVLTVQARRSRMRGTDDAF